MDKYTWFNSIFGFSENVFNYTLDEIPTYIIDKMGTFEQISIEDLKNRCKKNKKNNSKNIVVKYRNYYTNENEFDTSAIQFYSKENTIVQVASNFNCLEIPHEKYNPFNGYFLTKQMTDNTQGPSASGGAPFGSMLRLIKHKEKEINLLDGTPLNVTNGKLKYNDNKKFNEFNGDLIKIGLQRNVEANFIRTSKTFTYAQNGVKINQVFTSTCICPTTTPNKLSDILLEKAYEGTYLCAILTNAPTIVLTMIGGGVFNNSSELIVRNIMKIHNKYSEYLPKNCSVILPLYIPNPTNILDEFKKYDNVTIQLIK